MAVVVSKIMAEIATVEVEVVNLLNFHKKSNKLLLKCPQYFSLSLDYQGNGNSYRGGNNFNKGGYG